MHADGAPEFLVGYRVARTEEDPLMKQPVSAMTGGCLGSIPGLFIGVLLGWFTGNALSSEPPVPYSEDAQRELLNKVERGKRTAENFIGCLVGAVVGAVVGTAGGAAAGAGLAVWLATRRGKRPEPLPPGRGRGPNIPADDLEDSGLGDEPSGRTDSHPKGA